VRSSILVVAIGLFSSVHAAPALADAFEQLQSLAGEWEAELPGFGKLTNSIHLVSNGKAIEETIGTPTDNEVSLYTRDDGRILLTHFCAMTPDGHVARLETLPVTSVQERLAFRFRGASNLHRPGAPHMRRVVVTFIDNDHFTETWTKSQNGKDTVFDLQFVRR
jgi:hypothetical protein